MPAGSSPKRERQYEHIKESYEKRGQKGRAEEIAARTVNKDRAEAGETKGSKGSKSSSSKGKSSGSSKSSTRAKSSSSSSSKPRASSGSERTRAELYCEAQRKGVDGRSKMNKSQLERAVSK